MRVARAGQVDQALIASVRQALRDQSDPDVARAMQAYMKSETPSHGVKVGAVRATLRAALADRKLDWAQARDTARTLWDVATHREERHVAIELTGFARHRKCLVAEELPLFEHMIRSGAWWDYVDVVATHRVRAILDNDETTMRRVIPRWANDDDVWIRRSAILCQLLRKDETDRELLRSCIESNLGRDEFWLRKAIGWALRHYARTEPDWVVEFVDEHEARMCPLSKRQALKRLA